MRVEQLDYELPEGRIARRPAERREQSRLLVSLPDRDEHLAADVGAVLPERCVLVVNDTRVIPARLFGRKPTGGKAEFLLVRREKGNAELWSALGRASKR